MMFLLLSHMILIISEGVTTLCLVTRLVRVLWTARRSNQSILKEINSEYSLEGLMLKLTLQYFLTTWCEKLTHWKWLWFWERLRAGREQGDRGWDGWMASPTQWTEFKQTLGDSEGQGSLACCSPWGRKESDNLATEQVYVRFNILL